MHPTKFRFIWQSGFRGEDFFRNHQMPSNMAVAGSQKITKKLKT
jgi:hypothetical protein